MRGDQRKQQIMDAALKLFSGHGYHAVSVAEIIREVGTSRGTFYRYFSDKYDLFDQLLDVNFQYVEDVLFTSLDDTLGAHNLASHLKKVFIKLMHQQDAIQFLMMTEMEAARTDVVFAEKVNAFSNDLAHMLSAYFIEIQKKGRLQGRNPLILGYLILGLLKEIFAQWIRGDTFDDLETLIHEITMFIVYGLQPVNSTQGVVA